MNWTVANHKTAWNPWIKQTPALPTPQELAQGKTCRFHPGRPAVVATGFAPMCSDCLNRYEHALPGPLPHDELLSFLGKRVPSVDEGWTITAQYDSVPDDEASKHPISESCLAADQWDIEVPANSDKTSSSLPPGIPVHEHQCGQGFLSNGWTGWTPITMAPGGQVDFGQRTRDCPTCGGRLDENPPMPVGLAPKAAGAYDYYYHVAPRSQRERIQQHGLHPSVPSQANYPASRLDEPSQRMENQPAGVYVMKSPRGGDTWRSTPTEWGQTEWGPMRRDTDMWRIPRAEVQDIHPDAVARGAYYITHPIANPELYQPGTHEEDSMWRDHDTARGYTVNEPIGGFGWEPQYHPEWGIGKPNRVWGKTAGSYWHITDNPNFQINPQHVPFDAAAPDQQQDPGLMVTQDPHYWAAMLHSHPEELASGEYENPNPRQYAAEINLDNVPPEHHWLTGRGFGDERWVDRPDLAQVKRVVPLQHALDAADAESGWKVAAALPMTPPQVVEHPMGAFGYDGRRPMVWDPASNMLHVGPDGATHWDVLDQAQPNVGDRAAFGWIGPNPEADWSDVAYNRGQPHEVGWQMHRDKPSYGAHQMATQLAEQSRTYQRWIKGSGDGWTITADNYSLDSREWPDPSEPRPSKPPAQKGCTCQWGDKLNCPVHGLNADPELAELDHSWSLPENSPVGYPQDQTQGWVGPYQSSSRLWAA